MAKITVESPVKEFVISRVFNAPRILVWMAFTVPEQMQKWWGPKGSTVRYSNMDFRPNGIYHYSLRYPGQKDMWGKFVYKEIVAPEKIVLVNSFSDENGGLTRHPLDPDWPLEMLSTFTFTERNDKTEFKVQWVPVSPTESERKAFEKGMSGMKQGWTGTLDQLAEYLSKPDNI